MTRVRPTVGPARLLTAGLVLVVTGALSACGDATGPGEPSASSSAPDTATPAESPSEEPSETPPATETTTVFYVVDTRAGLRLAGEPHDVSANDPAVGAVEAMIAGPDDPDYASTWNADTRVLGVSRDGTTVTVDLSADARRANVGSEGAALMIQQLVYTVTEATDAKARVSLTIEGTPAGELWGAVDWSRPIRRADPLDVRQLVQIDTPREGEEVSSPVAVSGVAATFEANVPWRVLNEKGKVVKKGFTTAEEAFTFAPYSFTVELPPGTYTIEVSEDDPSGGEGGAPMTDTRTVTVS